MVKHPNADMDFFLAVMASRREILRPHVLVLSCGDMPQAILVGRIEDSYLETKFGYKVVHRAQIRRLTVIYGGLLGDYCEANARTMIAALMEALDRREADVIWFNGLRMDFPLYDAVISARSSLFSDHFIEENLHWKAILAPKYSEFLRELSSNTRHNLRRYSARLVKTLGDDLSIKCYRGKDELEKAIRDTEVVASKTYHRGLGVGFVDNPETRRLWGLAVEHGWFRGYVLYIKGVPCAFWNGLQYGRTFFTGTTGSDPVYREYRLGTFLLTKVFEDLCEAQGVEAIDFGFGDAQYKQDFCRESWREASVYVFATSLRCVWLNALRTPVMLIDRLGRRTLRRTKLLDKVKRTWRRTTEK